MIRKSRTRVLFVCAALLAMALIATWTVTPNVLGADEKTAKANGDNAKPQLMFVQTAEGIKVKPDANTFRLLKVNPQTLYFSDRPERIAGHLKMEDYLKEWTAKAGTDNFGANPPNAVLSVYEPGQAESTVVVVEITNPVVDGADLTYTYKIIKGKMPLTGGQAALFIDWIRYGVVGFGYRGVGVRGFVR